MAGRIDLAYTPDAWPIAASMLHRASAPLSGPPVEERSAEEWREALAEVALAGFTEVDPMDGWIRLADLEPSRLGEFTGVLADLGLSVPAISTTRRSVIDPERGEDHLAYAHRVLDTAARIGAGAVSVGLFGPLSEAQKRALWFWTAPGVVNPDDPAVWDLAVARLRELGRHAGDNGLELALEIYEDTYLGTADSAVRLVTAIDLPNVKINCDLGNLVRLHRPVEHWRSMMEKLAPFAGYWHAKNYFRIEDETAGTAVSAPAPLELGTINYREAVKMALRHGFRSAFHLEHYGGDGLSVCAANREYLRRILRAAVVSPN